MLNAVILYSVGSPQTLTTACLKDFLQRFLSDKLVVKMPRFLWQPILHSFILPTQTIFIFCIIRLPLSRRTRRSRTRRV